MFDFSDPFYQARILLFLAVFALSFLLGSIPFGLIISKVFYKTDIREHGSGNIGATNAIRTMGKAGGASVFILDFLKGALSGFLALFAAKLFYEFQGVSEAVWRVSHFWKPFGLAPLGTPDFGGVVWVTEILLGLAFLGCVWGHVFSPWLKFKGGKGVAVAVGCLLAVYGLVGMSLNLAVFIMVVLLTRYVSVGSIAAAFACPLFALCYFWGNAPAIILCALGGLTVVWAHRENIKRLLAGSESRIGKKKEA
ncbi:MAG: glycerol-3-phosphate 1-O-acyltransferase PlsY [Eggerthellaceae bacterium]|jgi:glycerol-3-phosphate acyltransferase PlsY|nr:glycerol-3-phosphate 1-O-acyltransferase PlsY [Eggerthellaceae bacterium]MDR2721417.1 glycerol-3-phosphate 1-O-acyltransferase PlsY [Coriobacteriaceae bacterium]